MARLDPGDLRLHGVRVPGEAVLGPVGGGFKLAQSRLGPGRIHHVSRWVGVCRRALEPMCRQAAQRELAPGEPLAGQQTVQKWTAGVLVPPRTDAAAAKRPAAGRCARPAAVSRLRHLLRSKPAGLPSSSSTRNWASYSLRSASVIAAVSTATARLAVPS
jgi:alkylation response protein AidB-like acyl-CoA dehydrogenase